ncbi:MAG: hypothetical protein U1E17_13450 [Geminicoccaceae bacterium]
MEGTDEGKGEVAKAGALGFRRGIQDLAVQARTALDIGAHDIPRSQARLSGKGLVQLLDQHGFGSPARHRWPGRGRWRGPPSAGPRDQPPGGKGDRGALGGGDGLELSIRLTTMR